MDLQLKVTSPKEFSLGVDAELAKLQRLQGILNEIGAMKPVKVDLTVTGADGLLRAKAQVESVVSLLNQAGEGEWAKNLTANLLAPEQALGVLASKIELLKTKLAGVRANRLDAQDDFDSRSAKGDPFAVNNASAIRKKLEAMEAAENAIKANLGAMQQAEKLLAAAAENSATAMHAQADAAQTATTQANAHATAAGHEAAALNEAAKAQEALNQAKKRSAQVTGGGDPDFEKSTAQELRESAYLTRHRVAAEQARERAQKKSDDWALAMRKQAHEESVGDTGDSRDVLAIRKSMRRHEEKQAREEARQWGDTGDSAEVLRTRRSAQAFDEKKAREAQAAQAKKDAEAQRESDWLLKLRMDRHHEDERAKKSAAHEANRPGLMDGYATKLGAVSLYTAAAATVYAGLYSIKEGVEGAIHTDREMAMLGGIFRGGPGEYRGLTRDLLGGAVSQGRTSEGSLAAGMKFSHLGLSRNETGAFTNLAMQGANIADIGDEESAHAVASYTEAFQLGFGQARVTLDQFNSIANQTNTTVKEIMETMGRTGAIAKVTGFGPTGFASLLAGGAGKTGLPLTQFANAFGMMLTNANDPSRQKELKQRFGLDVFRQTGEMKSGPELAADVHKKYQSMAPEEGLAMLSTFGGARQGQRLAAIFDNYNESQARAIAAQRDLNSAQNQNNNILDTTEAKLNAVGSAWKLMWHNAHQGGIKTGVNAALGALPGVMSGADTMIGFLNAMVHGNVDSFVRGDSAEAQQRIWNEGITKRETDAARKRSLAEASGMESRMFTDAQDRIATMPPEQAKKLIEALAIAHGGNTELTRADLEGQYAAGGGAAMKPVFATYAAVAKKREALEKSQADAADNKALREVQLYLTSLERKEREERARGSKSDPEILAGNAIEQANARAELLEMSQRRVRRVFQETDDENPNIASAREGLVLGMKARQGFYRGAPMGSHWETARLNRESEGLGAEENYLRDFQRANPSVSTILQAQEIATRRKEIEANRPAAMQADRLTRGEMDAHNAMGAFGVGRNESEKIFDSIRGIASMTPGILSRRGVGANGPENAADATRATGEALAVNLRLEHDMEALMARKSAIQREFNQLKLDENKAASEALAFASRGDQLQAALMKGYLQKHGPLKADEMIRFSQEALHGLREFNPDGLPAGFGKRGELMREGRENDRLMRDAKGIQGGIQPALDAAGRLPALPQPLQFPQVNVNVDAAEQIAGFLQSTQALMTSLVATRFESLEAQVSDWAVQMRAGMIQGAGADAVLGGN